MVRATKKDSGGGGGEGVFQFQVDTRPKRVLSSEEGNFSSGGSRSNTPLSQSQDATPKGGSNGNGSGGGRHLKFGIKKPSLLLNINKSNSFQRSSMSSLKYKMITPKSGKGKKSKFR